jgi:hypothetical protein
MLPAMGRHMANFERNIGAMRAKEEASLATVSVLRTVQRRLSVAATAMLAASAGVKVSAAEIQQQRASDPGPAAAVPIAVIDFDYQDTSGEVGDQAARHRAQMAAFMSKLRADLAASGKYAPVAIACGDPPCTATSMTPAALIEAAKQTGAHLLLYGKVQKMSTLIQWGKMQVVDLVDDRLVSDKMVTFRGDTDEAWRRAEAFLVEELRSPEIAK